MQEKTLKLPVGLGDRSYDIVIGQDIIKNAGKLISEKLSQKKVFIVTDENVAKIYLPILKKSLKDSFINFEIKILPAGEATKSFSYFQELTEDILLKKCERDSCVIALGGGVIGDISGFAAATLLRGIDFVQIPTSLLSQVDSSVGGKTGINTKSGKNLLGAFYQPKMVLIDVDALQTLDKRELLAGYAEVVKYGLLGDYNFWKWCQKNAKKLLNGDEKLRKEAIYKSCLAKAKIVSEDEKEKGKRALLNLGHTFGHAFEKMAGYNGKMLHGEAVSIGIVMAFELSYKMGLCKEKEFLDIKEHFIEIGLPVHVKDVSKEFSAWDIKTTVNNIFGDKKVKNGKVNFILAKKIGQTFITSDVLIKDIYDIFEKYIK